MTSIFHGGRLSSDTQTGVFCFQTAKGEQPASSKATPEKVLSPRVDITASAVSSQPAAAAPPTAAAVSHEVEKLQVRLSPDSCKNAQRLGVIT